ncbi:MAG TPA: Hsp20/alpha crystallin family protein [Smithella sp.]|nr:Hsp20/alpha crystallin family protein [Smithella sp.]
MAQEKGAQLLPVTRHAFPRWDLSPWFDESYLMPFGSMRPFFSMTTEMEDIMPNVDIFEDKGELVMKADLPGIKKDDVEVTLTDGSIRISGERKHEDEVKKKDYYKWERSYGSFSRSFILPAEVDTSKIKTTFKDGVLEIRMPKSEKAKSKEVKVKIQ